MDVDAVKIEKLTKKEREKCYKEGHCLQCKKPGHFIRDCNSFTKKTQPRKPQNPKRVAVIEEDKQELENQNNGIEEVTIGKVTIEDF